MKSFELTIGHPHVTLKPSPKGPGTLRGVTTYSLVTWALHALSHLFI